jgi:MinD-like ATPase involved in chromosome partitioning or flagellar assembly
VAADYTLGIIASARPWRSEFQAYVRDHVGGVRVKILREPRMAFEEQLDVIVIDDVSPFLNRSKVVMLQEHGVRVIGVFDPEVQEGLGRGFLETLGVDLVLPGTMPPEEMIRAISALEPQAQLRDRFDDVVRGLEFGDAPTSAPPSPRGPVLAVGGPPASGSTEVAVALADVLAARGESTVLLDLDESAPSVGRRLNFALQPNVLSALETTAHRTRPLHEAVGRRVPGAPGHVGFHVIPGLSNVDDWSQLRPHEVVDLLELASRTWRNTVVDTGSRIEDLVGFGLDRYGASRTVLADADVLVGVCTATPLGVLRFLDWAAEIRALGRDNGMWVFVNQVPSGKRRGASSDVRAAFDRMLGNGFRRAEVEEQLRENLDPRMVVGVASAPYDERVERAAWDGTPVASGAFTRAIGELADVCLPRVARAGVRGARSKRKVTA